MFHKEEGGKREREIEAEREITTATTPCGSVYNTLTVACSRRQRATGQCRWEGRMCLSAEYVSFHSIKYSSLWDVLTGRLPNK